MSDTEKRYAEAGLRPPAHDERVSEDIHHIDPELQPVDDTPKPKTKRTASRKRSSTTTQKES